MRIGVFVLCVLSVAAILRAGIRIFSHLYFTELRVIQEHSHEPHKRRSYAPDISDTSSSLPPHTTQIMTNTTNPPDITARGIIADMRFTF